MTFHFSISFHTLRGVWDRKHLQTHLQILSRRIEKERQTLVTWCGIVGDELGTEMTAISHVEHHKREQCSKNVELMLIVINQEYGP